MVYRPNKILKRSKTNNPVDSFARLVARDRKITASYFSSVTLFVSTISLFLNEIVKESKAILIICSIIVKSGQLY